MNPEQLQDAIGMVGEDLIKEAKVITPSNIQHKKKRRIFAAIIFTGILAATLISVGLLFPKTKGRTVTEEPTASIKENSPLLTGASSIMEASYPSVEQIPHIDLEDISSILDEYFKKTIPVFLSAESKENIVYSPLNTYITLGILAETTSGASRQQLFDLLGVKDIQTLRKHAHNIWLSANESGTGFRSYLANSIWLNRHMYYKEPTLQTIADTYYASTYQGTMGSDAYNQLLQTWFQEQTESLSDTQIQEFCFEPSVNMALASTVNFQGEWGNRFLSRNTKYRTFHGNDHNIVCKFMHTSDYNQYYEGHLFSAVRTDLKNNFHMWFILPNEDIELQSLLSDNEVSNFIATDDKRFIEEEALVHLAIPKFDIASNLDLTKSLQTLGVTHIFDSAKSDFSPLSESSNHIAISKIDHGTRVAIDERGCTSTSYTHSPYMGGTSTGKEVDFVLDKPFIFVIESNHGLPVFVGIVNQLG